jgi:hypothetical protein
MSEASLVAGGSRTVTAKRQSAKPSGSAKRSDTKTARLQLHLGEQTVKRLGVHCALVGRNLSAEADRILLRFLTREGRGRDVFGEPATADPIDPTE